MPNRNMNIKEPPHFKENDHIERIDYVTLITQAAKEDEMINLAAQCILQEFDTYYKESRQIPSCAQQAFENRDPQESLSLSIRRLNIYGETIVSLASQLGRVFPMLEHDEQRWFKVTDSYLPLIEGRYEEDLARAFIQSVRRLIYKDEWQPLDYVYSGKRPDTHRKVVKCYSGGSRLLAKTVLDILSIPSFSVPYRNAERDAQEVARRVNAYLSHHENEPYEINAIRMIDAGFFRNRGAYIVGSIELVNGNRHPLVISLENSEDGIFVHAVLMSEADAHNIFSSTLANFHVTNAYYHELSSELFNVMPHRPLGLHYSTIGFNHIGKVAVMDELQKEMSESPEALDTAVGFRGTVAIGFTIPPSGYVLKIIRDKPTDGYKWGTFEGVESVLRKYKRVHEINRTGSMLDNLVYSNIKLQKSWFAPELLEEMINAASESVSVRRNTVTFEHLIIQLKVTPFPVYLETATEEEAEIAVINLGHCIKNNASANIFNKDLDGRNYGVSPFGKVYLFDYDAVEVFTDVKVRTNTGRFDGEEDIPDWYFEDGVVFLPEEMEAGLRIPNRKLSRLFRTVHADLMTVPYWEDLQNDLLNGRVPRIKVYPDEARLTHNP